MKELTRPEHIRNLAAYPRWSADACDTEYSVSDVEVRPSGIDGLGVFAIRSSSAGDRIRRVNVVREVTPDAPIREDLGERTDHCNYPDGKIVLYCTAFQTVT